MFSSNQILEISGSLTHDGDLYNALEFALKASDDLDCFTREENPADCVYQITEDGRYCIGWAYQKMEKGWNKFPFDFDLNIISQIIAKHLEKQDAKKSVCGGYRKGFLMKAVPGSLADEHDGIESPFYGIVQFLPYTCFYSK